MADTASQSNTQRGDRVAVAGETLTGMEGRLVRLVNSSGSPVVKLPDSVADEVLFVLVEGAASGADVTIRPLEHGMQFRAYIDGACVTGDSLTLATIDATKDGKIVKVPDGAGTYFRVGVAEQSAADGSLALFRFLPLAMVTGALIRVAGETLTSKENRLVKLTNSSGSPRVILPNDVADETPYLLTTGAASAADVVLVPLSPNKTFSALIDGSCVTGDSLTLAAIDGTKDGKVVKLPTDADTYFRVGIAEASAADGELVPFRYLPKDVIVAP